jgi:hypothetical protein
MDADGPQPVAIDCALEAALLAFGEHYSGIAALFEWRFTRDDLRRVLGGLAARPEAA